MAQCKWCQRSGLFLKVNAEGICKSCVPIIQLEVKERWRVIQESGEIIAKSKNLDTKLSRIDTVIEKLSSLLKYEERQIPVTQPLPSALIAKYQQIRDNTMVGHLHELMATALAKAEVSVTPKAKIAQLSKVLLKFQEYLPKLKDPQSIAADQHTLTEKIQTIQLAEYLDLAQKAAFKGQTQKALDQYYDALYFLQHDEIDDALQQEQIQAIETKIIALGGHIAPSV
jgi:hypothetical protein